MNNYIDIITDAIFTLIFAIGTLYNSAIFNLCILLYICFKILFSETEYSIYIILLLIPNMNVFILSGIPIVNLIIPLSLAKIALKKKIKLNEASMFAIIIALYEMLHAMLYDEIELIQTIVWMLCFIYPAIYFSNHSDKYSVNKANISIYFSMIISSVYGIQYRIVSGKGFSIDSFNINDSARFGGGFYDPNYFALFCIVVIAIIIDNIQSKDNNNLFRIIPIFVQAIVIIVFLFLCFAGLSKSFFILFTIMILLFISRFASHSENKRRIVGFFVITAIVVVIGINYIDYDIVGLINKTLIRFENTNDLNDLTTNRISIINAIIIFLKNNPLYLLFGVGAQKYGNRLGFTGYAHSLPVEMLCSFGIFGCLLFILYVYYVYLYFYKKSDNNGIESSNSAISIPFLIFIVGMISLNFVEVESFYTMFFSLFVYKKMMKKEPR